MKIQLKGRAIPRNAGGDPCFKSYYDTKDPASPGLFEVFTQEEIVELVNRALYQLEYQHNAHRVRGQRQRDAEKLIKEKVKQLFHVSWMKATPDQIAKAKEQVEKETQ